MKQNSFLVENILNNLGSNNKEITSYYNQQTHNLIQSFLISNLLFKNIQTSKINKKKLISKDKQKIKHYCFYK